MTLTFSTLKSDIQRHLSVIGKRQYNKDGQNMFANITVSSEERPIFDHYIMGAAETVEGMLRPLVTAFSVSSGTSITLTLTNSRGAANFDDRCKEFVTSFIIAYTLNEYLGMNYPDLAKKYQDEATNYMQSLMLYAFEKEAPTASSSSYANVTGTVITS